MKKIEDLFQQPNSDKNIRLVTVAEVSKIRSVANDLSLIHTNFSNFKKRIIADPNDQVVSFFQDDEFMNHHLAIIIYEDIDKSMKRRLAFMPQPKDIQAWRGQIDYIMESLGIKWNFHDYQPEVGFKVKSTETKPKLLKRHPYFLYDLIELYDGELTCPDKQLEKVANKLAHLSSHENKYDLMVMSSFLSRYNKGKKNLYKIANIFGKHLNRTKLKISTKHIPKTDPILIEFPIHFPSGQYIIKNAFIICDKNVNDKKVFTVINPIYDQELNWTQSCNFLNIDIEENDSIEYAFLNSLKLTANKEENDVLNQYGKGKALDQLNALLSYCAKCLIYIHSAKPDIKSETGARTTKKNPVKIKKFYKNNCPFDLVNVGYSYHGLTYHVDQTQVQGHFRWQPCGTNREQIKLIWIDEHIRHYKKENNDS